MSYNNSEETIDSELLVIQQATKLIAHSLDPDPAVEGTLRLLSQLLGLNRGRVVLPNPQSGRLEIRFAYGLTEEERHKGSYLLGEGITGRVFQTGQMALIQNIDEEPTYLTRAIDRVKLPNEAVAYIAVPIVLDDQPLGVLAVHRLRSRERPFQRDLALLQVIATYIGQVLRVKEVIAERTAYLMSENKLLRNKLESRGAPYGIIGESPALQRAIEQAIQVARTDTTVLLLGESGTGKERFARMQHMASDRASGPFIGINCAAIPASLIESELFGHEKGAFTGATASKKGKIELADGGTLFLDEIGDLDMDLQAKLLKVLEQREIQRVGGTRDISVNVRIVAATHQNLQEAVNENRFRLDLFYRLNVFPIRLPPLRARQGDVPILARYFLNAANEEYGCNAIFGPGSLEILERYPWPGNIRQLENMVKRAVLQCVDTVIDKSLLERILQEEEGIMHPESEPKARHTDQPAQGNAVEYHSMSSMQEGIRPYARVRGDEVEQIINALNMNHGNKTRAAISIGLTPRQLRYRMQKLNIQY
ncbi:MAG: sigma 54-interacting transcriptional regulator [Gammaproteobacteria bacterium]|nr:sigma 54-interacting transcriptional regulator [Gammaproteobacteria bacterium]